jgi:hypothetical protein
MFSQTILPSFPLGVYNAKALLSNLRADLEGDTESIFKAKKVGLTRAF